MDVNMHVQFYLHTRSWKRSGKEN